MIISWPILTKTRHKAVKKEVEQDVWPCSGCLAAGFLASFTLRIGQIKALFTPPSPPRADGGSSSTPRQPAAAARSWAWRGFAQPGQAVQDGIG
jgi:hypothetical protein